MSSCGDRDATTTSAASKARDNHDSSSENSSAYVRSACGAASSALYTADRIDDLRDGALFDAAQLERPRHRRGAVVTLAQIEMRRRRNRASMRRTRQRKLLVLDHLRQQITVLESQLASLIAMCAQDTVPSTATSDGILARTRYSLLDVHELFAMTQAYQLEQVRLQCALQSYEMVAVSLEQLVDEHPAQPLRCSSGSDSIEEDADGDETFAWVNAVLSLLPPISKAQDIVRESYCDIVRCMENADALDESQDRVLGWSDKRSVNGCSTDFAFSKDFALEDAEALAAKSWTILTHTRERSQCMSSQHVRLRVISRITGDAIVMAKSVFCAVEQRHFCSIFMALRVQTARGYVIGSRSLCPLPQHMHRFQDALGNMRAHSDESVGIEVTRLGATPPSSQGCLVKFAGHVQSESEQLAQRVASNVLLATLQWENLCVRPQRYVVAE